MVGALQYLTMIRLDTYAIHVLSQFMHTPHILLTCTLSSVFLQGTLGWDLQLRPASTPIVIVAYSSTDWVRCKDSCRSTTSYALFFGPNLIAWHSKKRHKVCKSSTEVEHRAIGYTVAETIWIRKLLHDIGIFIFISPTRVYCDNISASYKAVNPIQHDRSKLAAVDYHFVRDSVAHEDLIVRYIPTKLQLANIFIKGLSPKSVSYTHLTLPTKRIV